MSAHFMLTPDETHFRYRWIHYKDSHSSHAMADLPCANSCDISTKWSQGTWPTNPLAMGRRISQRMPMSLFSLRGTGAASRLSDPKRVNRALFGAYYEEDIYDRFCTAIPAAMRAFWWRMPAAMARRNLIFVHVPRVAGTSIVRALYGEGCTRHHSIRYYRAVHPRLYRRAQSFALLRNPFDRFASAYAFVRTGGTPECRLSDVFAAETARITTVDDYLSFLDGRGPLDLDFVMRPQSWFVCDLATGAPLVKDLFLYGEDTEDLAGYLKPHGIGRLPWLNRSERLPLLLNARQRRRIENLYADDFALIESLRAQRRKRAEEALLAAQIAAE